MCVVGMIRDEQLAAVLVASFHVFTTQAVGGSLLGLGVGLGSGWIRLRRVGWVSSGSCAREPSAKRTEYLKS